MSKLPIKILIIDIETSPIITYSWGLHDQNISLDQMIEDWHILSYSAKFLGEDKIYYSDQRNEKDIRNDKRLVKEIWKLLDSADIVVGQNSRGFDVKKINSRMILHGMQPPSSFRQIDTMLLAKKHFGFTSNKLAYLSEKLCTRYKKSKHKKFPGLELWKECLKGNKEAWKEMQHYNQIDILSTEELYTKLIPWDNSVNFNVYYDSEDSVCTCGSRDFKRNGFAYTSAGKYQRFKCTECGSELRGKTNELSQSKRKSLKAGTAR